MATLLIFQGLYTPAAGDAVELNFDPLPVNYSEASCAFSADQTAIAGSVACSIPVAADFTLADAGIDGRAVVVYLAGADFTLSDAGLDGAASWESGVFRGTEASRASLDNTGQNTFFQVFAKYLQGGRQYAELTCVLDPAEMLYESRQARWNEVPHKQKPAAAPWALAEPLVAAEEMPYSAAPAKRLNRMVNWDQANPLQAQRLSLYNAPGAKPKAWNFAYEEGEARVKAWLTIYGLADAVYRQESGYWDQGTPHSWLWGGWPYPPPPPPVYIPSTGLIFYQAQPDFEGGAILVFGRPCFAWPLSSKNTQLLQGTAIVLHTINVSRTADNVEVPVSSVTLKFDSEAWAWGVSLNLQTPEIMALLESVNGEPCEIRIELDGIFFTVLIEEWGESREFGGRAYTATGRSALALFAYPYAPLRSYLETAEKTAAQLIDYELLNTGWAAVYHVSLLQLFTTDWLVPGGAWSYQNKAPVDCIAQIAKAAGARAYADRNARIVHIAPRYPVNPWDWDTATLDKTLPLNLVRAMATQLSPQPDYNHVIVSGQSHGVTVSANVSGSGGDISAPMVIDNLITYVQAGREKARNTLSNTGKQARITFNLPLNDSTGLFEPGQLVEVEDSTVWRGLVTGINITANHGIISQAVEVERHY